MQLLDYLRLAQDFEAHSTNQPHTLRISIISNFTDDLLKKAVSGLCISEGIRPEVHQVPFKQYFFELKHPSSALSRHEAEITFVFFDVNPYAMSEFSNSGHVQDVCNDLQRFCREHKGIFVLHTLILPTSIQHGRLFRNSALGTVVQTYNQCIADISEKLENVYVLETDQLVRAMGADNARDLRGLYAFSQPFSNDFLFAVAKEWIAYIRTLIGMIRKCIVLDLDNVLWGGIVGETGPLGVALGLEYPGNAYREFQRTLLDYYNRGIILAINSRNNFSDVNEVFEQNPHMILNTSHFASICVNWNSKAENMRAIAEELSIGLDSMVFLDDDPVNRELVRSQLPEVLVPEFSLAPEEYTKALLNLDAFHVLRLTDEDMARGRMYAAERERKSAEKLAPSLEEYLQSLNIKLDISLNDQSQVSRLAQLTQKTNQFNLTTLRVTEQEIKRRMESGFVFGGTVEDTFGPYGLTVLAALRPEGKHLSLDIFLMSCRILGRHIEHAFFRRIAEEMYARGFKKIQATLIPTKKNMPATDFLPSLGSTKKNSKEGAVTYEIPLSRYLTHATKKKLPVLVSLSKTP